MTDQADQTETKRGRVRRLLIEPLSDWGFRKPGDVREERFQKFLTDLADALTYMSDDQLETLRDMLRPRGEGKDRRGWPRMALINALAEALAPRPIEDHPTICSWFGSARGPKSHQEGLLVAEFLFLEKFKRPPLNEGDWRRVREKAADFRSRHELVCDRIRRGMTRDDDRPWLSWHDALEARALALLPSGGEDAA